MATSKRAHFLVKSSLLRSCCPHNFYPSLHFIVCLVQYFPHCIAPQGYILLLAQCDILPISLLTRDIFHCLPTLVFYTFHCYPGVYFIACLLWCFSHFIACLVQYFTHFIPIQGYISQLAYFGVLAISFLPRAVFHCYPGPYFIACLLQCFSHFISTQGYISLFAQCDSLPISLLPRAIFHCMLRVHPMGHQEGGHMTNCLKWSNIKVVALHYSFQNLFELYPKVLLLWRYELKNLSDHQLFLTFLCFFFPGKQHQIR